MTIQLAVDNTKDASTGPDAVKTEALTVSERAKAIKIVDAASYVVAGELLRGVKALQKRADETFDPICDATNKAHKAATQARAAVKTPLVEAEKALKDAILAYDDEQERVERERAAKVQSIAQSVADEVAIETASAFASAGMHAEAEAVLETAIASPATVIIPKSTPDVAGLSKTRTWSGAVDDVVLFLATALGVDPKTVRVRQDMVMLIDVRQKDVDRLAVTFKGNLSAAYPGLKAIETKGIAAKAS
jgi:hypothetical protein